MTDRCPSRAALERHALGGADRSGSADRLPADCDGPGAPESEESVGAIEEHLRRCPACAGIAASVADDHALLREVAHAAGTHEGGGRGGPPAVPGYEIAEELGRGGQGIVYRAVQRGTRRPVAVKVLLGGRFSTTRQRRRFEREIEVVAGLRHPGIVTLHDGGVAQDGAGAVPWFAMELVEGERLDRWARSEPRTLPALVEVGRAVVAAVAAAHRHGVIHRDLKPGNVLVDAEGRPRILDFGLAGPKECEAEGLFAGTPAFAAPEQLDPALGPVDAQSDVYALGLLLADLVRAGSRSAAGVPTGAPPAAGVGAVDERELRRLGADGDLAAIIARAAAVDRSGRYGSAEALAEDLRRRAEGLPVAARGESPRYILATLARRHRATVGFIASLALLLVAATIVTAALLVQRERQRSRAERNLAALAATLRAVDPLEGEGREMTVLQLVDAVGSKLDRDFADDPAAEATVRSVLGGVALNLGDLDRAERDFSRALERRRTERPVVAVALADAEHDLARTAFFRGRFAEAETLYRASLERRRRALGADHPEVATSLVHLASCRRRLGDFAEAESLLIEALDVRRALGEPASIAATINNIGSLRREIGDPGGALERYRESLALLRAEPVDHDWRVAHVLANIGSLLIDLARLDEAATALDEADALLGERLPRCHPKRLAIALESIRLRHPTAGDDPASLARLERENAVAKLAETCGGSLPRHAEVIEALDRLRALATSAPMPEPRGHDERGQR
ncbi:MAG TPA: serine/threonine-protein kinase [Phycisphaerales bacterium]|nr:serine/threonine-protein kinase [Phycisphaerales bacterium]HMP37827.1 serine/threonine-protein kinase [Phycisphaerales bacterium]